MTTQRDQVKTKLSAVWGWTYVHLIYLYLLDNAVASKESTFSISVCVLISLATYSKDQALSLMTAFWKAEQLSDYQLAHAASDTIYLSSLNKHRTHLIK